MIAVLPRRRIKNRPGSRRDLSVSTSPERLPLQHRDCHDWAENSRLIQSGGYEPVPRETALLELLINSLTEYQYGLMCKDEKPKHLLTQFSP